MIMRKKTVSTNGKYIEPMKQALSTDASYKGIIELLSREVGVLKDMITQGSPTGHFSEVVERMEKIING